mmetsp:Transcript_46205/g.148351  ORF Transcript_46205/g.148351 Transcript_46205/m.148351 type:complete len:315 (-) Transcript_46205:264-1208(-)
MMDKAGGFRCTARSINICGCRICSSFCTSLSNSSRSSWVMLGSNSFLIATFVPCQKPLWTTLNPPWFKISPRSTEASQSNCGAEPALPEFMDCSCARFDSLSTSFSKRLLLRCSSFSCTLSSAASSSAMSPPRREGRVLLRLTFVSCCNQEGPLEAALDAGRDSCASSSSRTRSRNFSISDSITFFSLSQEELPPPPASVWSRSAAGGCGNVAARVRCSGSSSRPPLKAWTCSLATGTPALCCRTSRIACAGVLPGTIGGELSCRSAEAESREAPGFPSKITDWSCGRPATATSRSTTLSMRLPDRSSSSSLVS